MSNAESEELVTTSREGVAVEKSFEPDDFPVPAIAFVIRSERDEPVSIRLVDTVPDRVSPEDIGFHPKYGAEHWGVEGDTIVFGREFEPNEQYTTVYGLRGSDADDAADFMSEPELETVDPPLSSDDSGQVVRDVIEGATADEDGAADGDAAAGDAGGGDEDAVGDDAGSGPASPAIDLEDAVEAVENEVADEVDAQAADADAAAGDPGGGASEGTAGATDGTGGGSGTTGDDDLDLAIDLQGPDSASAGGSGPTAGGSSPSSDAGVATSTADAGAGSPADAVAALDVADLVGELAAAIDEGAVDDEDVDSLRDALDVGRPGDSVDARIRRLQSQVADLEAYTSALEEFLDEEGDGQRVIKELETEFAETKDLLEDVESQADEAVETSRSVDDRLEETLADHDERLEETLAEYDEQMDERLEAFDDQFDATVDSLERRAEEIDDRVESTMDTVDKRLDSLQGDVEALVESEVDELWTAIDEAAAGVADVDDDVAAIREDLESVEEDVRETVDERLASLEDDLASIESDLTETVDERLATLEDDLDAVEEDLRGTVDDRMADLEAELDELAEMRDRLANALGGFTAGGPAATPDASQSTGDGQSGDGE